MANSLFTPYKNRLLGSGALHLPDWDADVIKAVLIDTADYTVDLTNHNAFDDVAGAAQVASANLSGVTIASGAVDADDTEFTSVSGDVCEAVLIYEDTAGAASTDPLLVWFDTFTAGMPVTPNGGNIEVVWHASGVLALV